MTHTEQDRRIEAAQRQMKRWSDARLAKELHFAGSSKNDAHQETVDWFCACVRESDQRAIERAGC